MPRHDTPKPHNGGQWTDARKRQFLVSVLRRAHTRQWRPRNEAKKKARVARGSYLCAICKGIFGPKAVDMDHIQPCVDPQHGFQGLDTLAARMFVEIDGYRCLCKACHAETTKTQREARKLARKNT